MSDINPSATTAAQDSRTSIRLEAGLTAPDFTLPSDNVDSVTLSALRGRNIILYFYSVKSKLVCRFCRGH